MRKRVLNPESLSVESFATLARMTPVRMSDGPMNTNGYTQCEDTCGRSCGGGGLCPTAPVTN